jgi:glycosyltransferase involved in cell wall biosynthesis
MKIALTADPGIPVPPVAYGGIERVIDMLARGLMARGHQVTLFAHADSTTPCERVPYPPGGGVLRLAALLASHVPGHGFDLVHSFGRLAYLAPLLPLPIPKLMSYQRAVTPRSIAWGHRLSRGTLAFSACSDAMMAGVRHLGSWHRVYNGVPMATYAFSPQVAPDAPLVFLGRVEEIKGPHLAIEIARRSGRRLVIAGNIPPDHQGFFDREVAPHVDGERVRYVGPVDDAQKNLLLGQAAAFVMPILWEEPFGIVMAEALACGTPVLGLRRGSVPEVVTHGETGFVEDTVDGLVEAVGRLPGIDRARCRARAEAHFSDHAIVEGYLAVYRELLSR